MGKVVVFVGFTGAGKSSIIKELLVGDSNFIYIPSVTTRSMREGEKEGQPYHFVGKKEFERMIGEGRFLEYEEVHGEYYGILRDLYAKELSKGKIILKDIDVLGALKLKNEFPNVDLLFINPPNLPELLNRLRLRGESEEIIKKRLERIEFEKSKEHLFDRVIVNEDLSVAVTEVRDYILRK